MLVSGGKVIAIDSIKKGNTNKDTLSGDGVWTNLGVNTDVIATTKKLNDTKSELESKINSASSVLSGEIKKKQDELKFELNKFDKITAIGPKNGTTTALAGGSNVVVSAGANTRVVTSSAGEQTIYTVNVTANPTNVSGENGLTARRDNNTSAYYLGLNNNYIQAITSVSSKLPITAFTSYSAAHKNDDVTPYTAGNYIEITNHKIIGHDWTNTIKSASSNAVTTVRNTFNGNGTSYSGYNGKPFIDNTTPKWSVVGDGNRISVTSANNKYGVSWDGRGIATEEWVLGKNYLPKDVASSTYLTIASANEIYQKKLNAGAGIVIKNETDISVDISVSGDIIPYSAGEGIGIDNHIVSITADYLSANALKDLSGRWESAANALEASAAIWDTVSAKVNKTEFEEFKTSAHNELEKKLDKVSFESWSANKDYDFYSAGNGIKIENHIVSVSADYALSADVDNRLTNYYDKDEVDEKFADFGGFVVVTTLPVSGDNKKIYLINDPTSPNPDQYKEYIYTENVWKCIGDTSVDLTQYYKKTETSGAEEISTEFTNTSAWANATFQPIGDYVVSSTDVIKPGSACVLVNDNNNVQWSGLDVSELGKKYIVKSTNGTIGVGSATVGNVVTYDLSGAKIVGENGVSAVYNPATNEWNVGLEDNDIGFAKYSSSANVYTASAVVNGYTEDFNVNPTKINFDNNQILLKTGFYHVDVQTNFTIANPDNNYYNVLVKSIPDAASITQMIDGSYSHTETVDLSFDIRITNDDTPLEISVENYKTNETFAISNLNIHEIEGGVGNYQAGNGISIGNDTIAAKIGNGLEFNESSAIQVKLGKGLKFDDSQGVQAVTIDSDVNEVIETVQELKESLDTKITDNYPPAMITIADLQVANQTQYAPSNGGMLIGYLFTCPIIHKIYAGSNNDYKTKIGIYTKQCLGNNKKVILGIYEYQPDYVNPDTQQVGKTEALCDTGIIELQQGYAEYDVKNLGTKTTHEMKPGCFYYATIYLSYKAGDTNGITLFGAPGYNTQVNNLKPGITITNVNSIRASLYEGLDGYSPDLNFDQMGFSWQYNSYPPSSTSDPYTSQGIVEAHAAGRPYFAIRNVKIVTGN